MDKQLKPKRCLLVTQRKFHSYEKFLKDELLNRGYEVDIANDEYPTGFFGRIIGKIQLPLIFPVTYSVIKKRFLDNHYDVAIIIKGRGFSSTLVKKMKESIPKIVGFNWDSFLVNKSPLKWYKTVNAFYTFDYADADKYDIPCVELFSSLPPDLEGKKIRYDISALGRNYVGRLKYIDTIMNILKPQNPYIFLYENNVFEMMINFIRNPRLYLKYWRQIYLHPLKYHEYLDIVKSSEFTVDYAHNQTGITMRCYESLSLKTKIISNNPYMDRSKYFNESNHIVVSSFTHPAKIVKNFNKVKDAVFEFRKRDITDFIDDLLA